MTDVVAVQRHMTHIIRYYKPNLLKIIMLVIINDKFAVIANFIVDYRVIAKITKTK